MKNRQLHFLYLVQFLIAVAITFPAAAQYSRRALLLTDRADSAIEAGSLNLAERLTRQALTYAIQDQNEELEAKILVNLISIKIEQENNIPIDEWYDRALAIINKHKDSVELANLWNIKARQLLYNQKYEEARSYYSRVGQVYNKLGRTSIVAYYYNDLGYLEEAVGNPHKATDWFLKSIHIFEQTQDKSGLANTLGNLANTYFYLDEPVKALEYARRSLRIRKESGDKEGMAIVLGNITRIYLHRNQMDSARYYQQEYIHYARQSGKKKTLADSYVNLAMMHHAGKRYDQALDAMQHAIGISQEMHHPNLANFYRMAALFLGKMERDLEMERYYDSCYALLRLNNNNAQYRDYYATRMNYFKSKGDYRKAFENYELYIAYRDTLLNASVKKQVAQYEIQYETQKKNMEIATAKNEKIQQQLYYNITLGLLSVGVLTGLILFNRYKFRKKLEQKQLLLSERNRISAELHDEVGSSLSAIHLMSHAMMNQSYQAAPQLQGNLQKIVTHTRSTMDSISDIVWSMHPENGQVARVFSRMKMFAAEVLESLDIDLKVHATSAAIDVCLSPEKSRDLYLVFKEAINNISKYAHARKVIVHLYKQAELLVLCITDDGRGFDPEKTNNGNGLPNMRRRMEKHVGHFDITSKEGAGTVITFHFPTHDNAIGA